MAGRGTYRGARTGGRLESRMQAPPATDSPPRKLRPDHPLLRYSEEELQQIADAWDWDAISTPQAWRHSHNATHHHWANVLEHDKDLGFEMLRVDPDQPWEPTHVFQVAANLASAG